MTTPGDVVLFSNDNQCFDCCVENLEDTVGFAMNFVSKSGTANHIQDQVMFLQIHPVFQLAMNYLLFEENADEPFKTQDPLYTTFGEYKAQY